VRRARAADAAAGGRQGSRVSQPPRGDHYSYTVYNDPATARSFDERRFGGVIGELLAGTQARVLTNFIGRVHPPPLLHPRPRTARGALRCGRGAAHVPAADASIQMLAVAKQRAVAQGVEIAFEVGDAHALRFPDRAFEVAVSLRVLMHSPDWRRCLSELCRVA